jgi:hypothetical protein
VAEIAIDQAAFAGFGILRRKPWAPLVWSLLYAGILGGLVVCLGGAFGGSGAASRLPHSADGD